MNKIQKELFSAQEYLLEKIPAKSPYLDLVALTPDNVARVEAMILSDSDYFNAFVIAKEPKADKNGVLAGGSSAYWFTRLKSHLSSNNSSPDEYDLIIDGAVEAVDRENSTHLNADGIGRFEISQRIKEIDPAMLLKYLRKPDETNLELIHIIAKATNPTGITSKGKPYRARKNISFASKFCHYACYFMFEGEPEQDNYSIYDNVLKRFYPYM